MSIKSKPKINISEKILVFLTQQLALAFYKQNKQEKQIKKQHEKAKNN